MTKWANSIGQYKSPALVGPDGSMASSNEEKRSLLQETHLPADRSHADIPSPTNTTSSRQPWPSLTQQEVEYALLKAKNTTPGTDEISATAIKKAWPVMGNLISATFALCLEDGWHPTSFRTAVLCVINKPGKRDKSQPRSYRLIALLSVLGKGLERIIARRLAWEAISQGILPPGYVGALPLRSATDLAALLTDDIQQAFNTGHVLSTLTFDVQGGFDTILPNRLASRLIQQGWPPNLISWVKTFLTGRSASIRLDGSTGTPFPLTGSLPQGSPASPILFMLYLQPLFSTSAAPGVLRRKGYADDGRITAKSDCLEKNCRTLEREFLDVRQWCEKEQIPLDPKKIELMHFSRKRNNNNPELQILPTAGKTTASGQSSTLMPIPLGGALRWLGVLYD